MRNDSAAPFDNDLFKEKGLWSLYRATWRAHFPWRLMVPAIISLLLLALYVYLQWPNPKNLIELARQTANAGFSFAATMLGFLVAGFTIFSTIMKPGLMKVLHARHHPRGEASYLKWTFLVFMHVFIHYVAFMIAAGFVIVFGGKEGLLSQLAQQIHSCGDVVIFAMAALGLTVIGSWFFHLISLAGAFVWNIYQVCALVITVETEELVK